MPLLRLLLIVLLLLNVLALAAGLGWLGSSAPRGEPERLTNQINPELIELRTPVVDDSPIPPQPPEATSAPRSVERVPERSEPAPEGTIGRSTVEPPSQEQAGPLPTATGPVQLGTAPAPGSETTGTEVPGRSEPPSATEKDELICIAIGDLSEQQARTMGDLARDIDSAIAAHSEMSEPPGSWWVKIPPAGSRQAAEQRVAQLRALGVSDLFIVREEGPNQFAISLGLFRTETRAQQHLADLEARRVRGAQIAPRTPAVYRLELSGPASSIDAVARQLANRGSAMLPGECVQ